ncbi:DUF2306 domain-containing protein [Sinosporangium siamense]|uniref:DUF2306 domain-containing protein n=1 Tax=Sinosporangium siamense TaxID=1367973 RepID=A0A919RQV8_9ACTN|nr:DUF2306 domain-containing protein [Sinosporangium siamense]GII96776.1 hypothetical protein Ssi02_70070 [Sinosporangium siamense]
MTTASAAKSTRRRRWWALWGLMAISAIGIAAYAVPPYLSGDPANSNVPVDPDVALHYLSLGVHALPGGLALIIGPLQFVSKLRVSRPKLHRMLGRIYMISILIASAAALVAATVSLGGFAIQVAFYILTVAWLYTLAKAYRCIRRGEVQLHRIWMIRNYALTFAAVTLRVYLIAGLQLKQVIPSLEFDQIYTAAGWASILGNVLVAEYFIVQRTLAPLARRRQRQESTPATTPVPAAQS